MRTRDSRFPAWALAGLLTVGCTVGPDYEPPVPAAAPDAWKTAVAEELGAAGSPLESWWIGLGDPVLTGLIERAAESSLTLQIASMRVLESRYLLARTGGLYDPDVILDASYARTKLSDNGGIQLPGGFDATDVFSVGAGLSWEVDVFGRIRRGVEAASANLEASVEDYRDVLVILLADVAASYVDARTLEARLRFAGANVEAQRDTLQLTRDRFDAGLTSGRDVAQAESNLAISEAVLPQLEAALEAARNRLSVLVGEAPGAVDGLLVAASVVSEPPPEVTLGLPAELLRRRPDVRRAERQLAAQTALVGVATADLYPTFSLTGVIGLEATDAGNLVESDSATWSLVPGLRWNLFNGGKVRNQIRIEEARTEQVRLAYEQTVLLALEQVESTLVAYEQEKVRRVRLAQAVDATQRTVELVHTQYVSGLTDFQSYLDAQRSLFSQQDALVASQGQVVQNLIALNRALGGGWALPEGESER